MRDIDPWRCQLLLSNLHKETNKNRSVLDFDGNRHNLLAIIPLEPHPQLGWRCHSTAPMLIWQLHDTTP